MKKIIIICCFLLFIGIIYLSQTFANKSNNIDGRAISTKNIVENDICQKFKRNDSLVNELYKGILLAYKADSVLINTMKQSQQLWIQLRTANVDAIFSDKAKPGIYGSGESLCKCVILNKETEERINYLKGWVTGIPEGDICTGSRKLK